MRYSEEAMKLIHCEIRNMWATLARYGNVLLGVWKVTPGPIEKPPRR